MSKRQECGYKYVMVVRSDRRRQHEQADKSCARNMRRRLCNGHGCLWRAVIYVVAARDDISATEWVRWRQRAVERSVRIREQRRAATLSFANTYYCRRAERNDVDATRRFGRRCWRQVAEASRGDTYVSVAHGSHMAPHGMRRRRLAA